MAWTVNDNLYFSAAGLSQKEKGATAASDFDSWAFDIGGKYKIAGLEVLGWYYKGSGVGTTALFFDASAPHGPEELTKLPMTYLSIIIYPK